MTGFQRQVLGAYLVTGGATRRGNHGRNSSEEGVACKRPIICGKAVGKGEKTKGVVGSGV